MRERRPVRYRKNISLYARVRGFIYFYIWQIIDVYNVVHQYTVPRMFKPINKYVKAIDIIQLIIKRKLANSKFRELLRIKSVVHC